MIPTPRRLPYKIYYWPILFLAICGIINATYLSYSHYQNYTDPAYASFCAISRAINCDTVAQSPWSILFGLPVALWGLMGYVLFLILLIALRRPTRDALPIWSLAVVCGFGYALAAAYFGYISVSKIHSYCILCLLTYGINFGLFFGSWFIRRRFSNASIVSEIPIALRRIIGTKWFLSAAGGVVVATILMMFFLPHYWTFAPDAISTQIPHGVTEDGHPWVGAEHPELTITEFSDYMCFQCKKMHFLLRRLIQTYPDRIRLIHWQFPMDQTYNPLVREPFHSGSGKMALIAIYAQTKGKFWEVNDLLFDIAGTKQDFNTRKIAEFMGVPRGEVVQALESRNLRLLLKHDIAVGIQKGITGTPGFVIDDRVYLGTIPKQILQKATGQEEN